MSNPEEQDNEWMNAPMGKYSELEELQIRWESSVKAYAEKCQQIDELSRELEEARKERDKAKSLWRKWERRIPEILANVRLKEELSESKLALAKLRHILENVLEVEKPIPFEPPTLSSIVELVKAVDEAREYFDQRQDINNHGGANEEMTLLMQIDPALSKVKKELSI